MKRGLLFALPLVLAGCDLDLTGIGVCNVDRDLDDEITVGSANVVRILADEGDITVRGRPGLTRVRVSGRACAESRSALDDIDLVVQRSGDAVRVIAVVPQSRGQNARLDLVIEVPSNMIVDIEHNDGDIDVRQVRAAFIIADEGSIFIEDVTTDVEVADGSGDIQMRRIGGDIFIIDTSGHIDIRETDGLVFIEEDGSGNILIRDVLGDVHIVEDGSGDIDVQDVGGDFIVEFDTSGRISHRNIRGRVYTP